MRFLLLAALAATVMGPGTAMGQDPGLLSAATLVERSLTELSDPSLREALGPVEQWMGRRVVIYDDRGGRAFPYGDAPMWAIWPPKQMSGEALIPAGGAVYVGLAQARALGNGARLAGFLSHAKAHDEAGHAERVGSELAPKVRLALAIPHFPRKYIADVSAFVDAAEREIEQPAARIYQGTGCAEGSCAMFDRLMEALGNAAL